MSAMEASSERVVFYQLTRKFVDRSRAASADSKQLLHYTLAIGHHIGVVDCLAGKLDVPIAGYRAWVSALPNGDGRRKLEGVLRYGEIEITAAHTRPLRQAFGARTAVMSEAEAGWTASVDSMLQAIDEERAIYLIVRRRR